MQADPWWFLSFMNPFNKQSNIPCLRSKQNRAARSEADLMDAMKHPQHSSIPWMIGPTFQTDGRQIKLQLITSEVDHPGAPGLKQLHNEGYRVSFEDQSLESVLQAGNGVYNLKHIHTEHGLSAFDGVRVTPIDPGDAVVVEGAHYNGEDVRRENAVNMMSHELFQRVSFSGQQYRLKTLATLSETTEVRRRAATPYGQALEQLMAERKKTCNLDEFVQYCMTWTTVEDAIWTELLTDERRLHRFARFRAVQKTVEEIAELIAPRGVQTDQPQVVLFEDGSWKARKGQAAAPRKKIIRVLLQRAVTIMIPAAWTSQSCPACGHKTTDGEGRRTKTCTRTLGCPLHDVEHDRDQMSKTVVGLRGVYCIAGLIRCGGWRPQGYTQQ